MQLIDFLYKSCLDIRLTNISFISPHMTYMYTFMYIQAFLSTQKDGKLISLTVGKIKRGLGKQK